MSFHDFSQFLSIGHTHFKPQAAPQKCGRKHAFAITGKYDYWESVALHSAFFNRHSIVIILAISRHHIDYRISFGDAYKLRNLKFAFFENIEQIVWQIDITLVYFIDQEDPWILDRKQ